MDHKDISPGIYLYILLPMYVEQLLPVYFSEWHL